MTATTFLLFLSGLIFLVLGIISVITLIRNWSIMSVNGFGTVIVSLIMIILEFLMLAMTLFAGIKCYKDEWHIPIVSAAFVIAYCFISFVNFMFMRGMLKNLKLIEEQSKTHTMQHNLLIDNISHEIRNPMNTIVGLTEVMKKDETLTKLQAENMEAISDASLSLLAVVNNLIDYTKIQYDRLDIICTDYKMRDLLDLITDKAEHMNHSGSVDFVVEVSPELPETVVGDDVRISQVICALISNSFKYTDTGVVTLKVSHNNLNLETTLLQFEVEDTGGGIPDDDKYDIYLPVAVPKFIGQSEKGTRLSLYIIKTIVEKMGGNISYSSKEKVGTKFRISIPQKIVSKNPIGEYTLSEVEANYKFTAPLAKVLVVDDNMVNLFVAKEILNNYEIDVMTATSGAESIALTRDNKFDIIFMDYLMPRMDGHEALLKIRELDGEYFKKVPIVALTAKNSPGGEKMYLDDGFGGYLPKPIDVHELERILLKFLPPDYINKLEVNKEKTDDGNIEEKSWYKRLCSVLIDFEVMKGLEYCNYDYASYINLLRVIYNESYNQTGRLKNYADEEDIENYRIAVHSMKSVASAAGDMKLSFICSEHENAAKNFDTAYIKNHVNTLLSEYEVFLFRIDTILQRENEIMNK